MFDLKERTRRGLKYCFLAATHAGGFLMEERERSSLLRPLYGHPDEGKWHRRRCEKYDESSKLWRKECRQQFQDSCGRFANDLKN